MPTTLFRPAALVAAALVLVSGSAYAGVSVGRNSVGSPQVKNNSLGSIDVKNNSLGSVDVRNNSLGSGDVKDRSIRRGDLAVGAAPRVYTFIRSVSEGTTRILDIPGFSRFDASCSSTSVGIFAGFGASTPDPDGPWQQHGVALSDIADNNPVGGATITGIGGGVGFASSGTTAPSSGLLVRGDYWGRSDTLMAHGTIAWGFPGVPCRIQLQVVVEELTEPDPVRPPARSQARRAGGTCQESGAAYCVTSLE